MRDRIYEQELQKHIAKMTRILDTYMKNDTQWSEIDVLAIERGLQVLIESVVGLSRYVADTCFGINISRSREAIDELKALGVFTREEQEALTRIIGSRNVLVHDYLNVDEVVVHAIVKKQEYRFISEIARKLMQVLDEKGDG